MRLTIDTSTDTFVAARIALAALYPSETERLATEQRADLPALRTRIDTETTDNAAAAAAFGNAHTPNRPDDHIPAAAPAPITPYPMPTVAQDATRAAVPTPPVPVTPVPPTVVPGGVALDVEGLPWDVRIHAATKTRVTNGSWKKKKGLDPVVLGGVVAELRAVMGLPAATLTPGIPSTPAALAAAAPPPPPVPVPFAPVGATPIPPAAPPAGPINTFAGLMSYISSQVIAGKWSHLETLTACQANGVTALPLLSSRPDLIPAVAATIQALIAAKPT